MIKSFYERFFAKMSGPSIDTATVKVAAGLWKVKSPSKILFFGWRVIQDRIATKVQFIRGVYWIVVILGLFFVPTWTKIYLIF